MSDKAKIIETGGRHVHGAPSRVRIAIDLSWSDALLIMRTGSVPEPITDQIMAALLDEQQMKDAPHLVA